MLRIGCVGLLWHFLGLPYNYFKFINWILIEFQIRYHLIRITCPCVLFPFIPHFYIAKLGFTGVYIIFLFCSKTYSVGTRTHNICFVQKYENSQKYLTENCHFYSREKSLYIAWVCFRNVFQQFLQAEMVF